VDVVRVGTTEQLRAATLRAATGADILVMAAAPADFRPARYAAEKIKKVPGGPPPTIELVANPDIAAEFGAQKRAGQLLVAFAAETAPDEVALSHARDKLSRKRADLIVVNRVGADRAFGTDTNAVTVLDDSGATMEIGERDKDELADAVWDLVSSRLARGGRLADSSAPAQLEERSAGA
jgi:phosphopantothenoylcysteine decarboxylase/phosphopantothenate--cysteine ligase